MTAFKLYTTTKFRVYKNRGGRFVPLFKNGSTWESFTELGTMATRVRRSDAEKFIQRKADRLFYGQAPIEYVEAEQPQKQEEVPAPLTPTKDPAVRNFADLTPEERIASLTRLIDNPHFPEEERQKLLLQRSEREAAIAASQSLEREQLYADFVIPEGKPFVIRPYVKPERQIPGRRNALRIDYVSPLNRCNLLPKDERAAWLRENRPNHIEQSFDQFDYCYGKECKSCPIASRNLKKFDSILCSHWMVEGEFEIIA